MPRTTAASLATAGRKSFQAEEMQLFDLNSTTTQIPKQQRVALDGVDAHDPFPTLPTQRWPGPQESDEATWDYVQRVAKIEKSNRLEWSQAALEAWDVSKKIIARAIALAVPDSEGAQSGENPFVYLGDRSGPGVGGGRFQRPGAARHVPPHLKGVLRCLGLWSKALDKTRQNWTTWEGELFSIREGSYFRRDIISGCHFAVGTGHLDNRHQLSRGTSTTSKNLALVC